MSKEYTKKYMDNLMNVITEQASKHSEDKTKWHLLAWSALEPVVRVMEHGAAKYGKNNWRKGREVTDYVDAVYRHLISWLTVRSKDEETGISHLAHAVCNLMFLLYQEQRPELYSQLDNRRRKENGKI